MVNNYKTFLSVICLLLMGCNPTETTETTEIDGLQVTFAGNGEYIATTAEPQARGLALRVNDMTPIDTRADSYRRSARARNESVTPGSNVLKVDADGDTELGIFHPEYDLRIDHILPIPERNSLIFSFNLDGGGSHHEDVARRDCALFEYFIRTSELQCIQSGLYVDYDLAEMIHGDADERHQANLGPMQYVNGELFLLAWRYVRECEMRESDEYCTVHPVRDGTSVLYRLTLASPGDGQARSVEISRRSEKALAFQAFSDSSAVFKYDDPSRNLWDPKLKAWAAETGVQRLTNVSIGNFIADAHNTAIFDDNHGSKSDVGLAAASGKGVRKTALRIASPEGDASSRIDLNAVMKSQDGRLFGIAGAPPAETGGSSRLGILQLLPYRSDFVHYIEPTRELMAYFGDRGITAANGKLFYLETILVKDGIYSVGDAEVIRAVDIDTGETQTLLAQDWQVDPTARRYAIDRWQLNGDHLQMQAFNQSDNQTELVSLDTRKPLSELNATMQRTEMTGLGETPDILSLRQVVASTDGGPGTTGDVASPQLLNILARPDNPWSISLEFNQSMDADSVEAALTLSDVAGGEVPFVPVVLGNYVHIVPDTSVDGVADNTAAPLKAGKTYRIEVDKSAAIQSHDGLPIEWTSDTVSEKTISIPAS